MPIQVHLNLDPESAADESALRKTAASLAKLDPSQISGLRIIRRSVDARQRNIKVNITAEIFTGEE